MRGAYYYLVDVDPDAPAADVGRAAILTCTVHT
jgi:hypothetical protein